MEKNFIFILVEILIDVLNNIRLFIESNLKNFARLLTWALPFAMFFIGQDVGLTDGHFTFTWDLVVIPIAINFLVFVMNSYANKIGKGITVPIPQKRFTEVDDDGEVTIENSRIHELILYLANLEDWLERKGLM